MAIKKRGPGKQAKLSIDDAATAFMAVLDECQHVTAAPRRRLQRDGVLVRRVSKRLLARYERDGGDPTNGQKFLEWLKKNWPTILGFIISLLV